MSVCPAERLLFCCSLLAKRELMIVMVFLVKSICVLTLYHYEMDYNTKFESKTSSKFYYTACCVLACSSGMKHNIGLYPCESYLSILYVVLYNIMEIMKIIMKIIGINYSRKKNSPIALLLLHMWRSFSFAKLPLDGQVCGYLKSFLIFLHKF